jgi:hypothetical protein
MATGGGGASPSQGIKRPGREADNSPPFSANVKNAWSYTSTRPYVIMDWNRNNFTFTFTDDVGAFSFPKTFPSFSLSSLSLIFICVSYGKVELQYYHTRHVCVYVPLKFPNKHYQYGGLTNF